MTGYIDVDSDNIKTGEHGRYLTTEMR
jgi:hypothetical protein